MLVVSTQEATFPMNGSSGDQKREVLNWNSMEGGSQLELSGGELSSGGPWRDIQVKVNGGNFSGRSK